MKEIPLTQGQVALVDDCDYAYLSQWKWRAMFDLRTRSFYARMNPPRNGGKRKHIAMHRVVMMAAEGEEVDHGNHDTLDNRRENLTLTTREGNSKNQKRHCRNTSGYCGVYWHKRCKKWMVSIQTNGNRIHIGYYADKADAITARQAANIKYGFHTNHGLPTTSDGRRFDDQTNSPQIR